jgi:hypothetical protein
MPGSMVPDPPVRAAKHGHYLRFGLIIAIGLIWAQNSPHGLPGTPGGNGGSVRCPHCGERGHWVPGGWYLCKNKHLFRPGKGKGRK